MNLTTENILLVGSILLFVSLIASKTSNKLGVPVLILFLATGMIAGSEGFGGVNFDDPKVAQFIGIVALNFILFSGGFETDWRTIKPILWKGISLSTFGVIITAVTIGLLVWLITDFTIYEGILLGAIISSTDAAAVFSILRSKNVALKGNLRPLLELESGSNDPTAYFLTIAMTGLVMNQDASLIGVLPFFFRQLIIGTALGFLCGFAGKFLINRIRLEYEGLYTVLAITLMFFTFSATDYAGGNGFLAVYLAAVYLGNQDLIHKRTILKAFDGLAWMMQILLFLTLGLLVFPSEVLAVAGIGLTISLFLMLVARPLSVFISMLPFRMNFRTRWFISWVGLRGAVPIVFATYPLLAGMEKAHMIFNIVFFISVTSVALQGTTLPLVARLLRVALPAGIRTRTHTDLELYPSINKELIQLEIPPGSPAIGKPIVELGLPRKTFISIIRRNGHYFTPEGSTEILANDVLYVLSESLDSIQEFSECLGIQIQQEQVVP